MLSIRFCRYRCRQDRVDKVSFWKLSFSDDTHALRKLSLDQKSHIHYTREEGGFQVRLSVECISAVVGDHEGDYLLLQVIRNVFAIQQCLCLGSVFAIQQ